MKKLNIILYFFTFFFYTWRLNSILFLSITQLVRCLSPERDWSSGDHVHVLSWVTPQIFIPTVTVVVFPPSSKHHWHLLLGWFTPSVFPLCLVIIDPVPQGDAQISHPLCQVSAVPELLCGVVGWLCVVCSYVTNDVTVCSQPCNDHHCPYYRLGTSIYVTSWPAHLGIAFCGFWIF